MSTIKGNPVLALIGLKEDKLKLEMWKCANNVLIIRAVFEAYLESILKYWWVY